MLHKTNGTIEKVFLQGFISAKKYFFYPRPPQFFWLMLHAIPACHFVHDAPLCVVKVIPVKFDSAKKSCFRKQEFI